MPTVGHCFSIEMKRMYVILSNSNQPTKCNNFSRLLLDIYVQLSMFHNRPDHDQQQCYRYAPAVKPEAATAVVELLRMGVRTPETC
jgi:hypothetical protein